MFKKFNRGDPRLPPLIFLHGFLGAKEDWLEILPYFEKQFFCTALDLPGHGSTPYSDEILNALKVELGASRPILIGYSMGGRLALQLQELASAVVAISAHPGLSTQAEREDRWKKDLEWAEKVRKLPWPDFIAEWYAQPVFTSVQHRPKQNTEHLAAVLQQLSLAHQPHIDKFLSPTLFLYGEQDWKYRDLYSTLPKNIAVRGIENCGHAVHLENPAACATEILKWVEYANS